MVAADHGRDGANSRKMGMGARSPAAVPGDWPRVVPPQPGPAGTNPIRLLPRMLSRAVDHSPDPASQGGVGPGAGNSLFPPSTAVVSLLPLVRPGPAGPFRG